MKRAVIVLLCGLTMLLVYSLRVSLFAANPLVAPGAQGPFQGVQAVGDIAKFEWVDKHCRMWAADGDIDVDQTCLVVQTVTGHVVVIPNQHNDEWLREIADPETAKDKWVQRFFAIGGGAKWNRK